jgi:hypothetical protein
MEKPAIDINRNAADEETASKSKDVTGRRISRGWRWARAEFELTDQD